MNDFVNSKIVTPLILLALGLAAIIYLNPPHTPCQSQVEIYNDGIKALTKPFRTNLATCKESSTQGGCLAIFDTLEKMQGKLTELGVQCQQDLASDARTRNWITTGMELFTKLAWGSKPPASYLYRANWLEISQVAQFCRLKKNLIAIFGEEAWLGFVNTMLTDLPGAEQLGRNDAWGRSLLSDKCSYGY